MIQVESLIRFTALNIDAPARQQDAALGKKESSVSTQGAKYPVRKTLHETFLALWIEHLGRLASVKEQLRDTLLFLLPGQWGSEPCNIDDIDITSDDDAGYSGLVRRFAEYSSRKQEAQQPTSELLRHLENVVALFQPRPQRSCETWLKEVDCVMLALRTFLVTLHTAFFKCFAGVDDDLCYSVHKHAWRDSGATFATAVYELCRTIDAKLAAIVSRTISANLHGFGGDVTLQIFHLNGDPSDPWIEHLVSCLERRLDNAASVVAMNTPYASVFSPDKKESTTPKVDCTSLFELVRVAASGYAEKLRVRGERDDIQRPCFVNRKEDADSAPARVVGTNQSMEREGRTHRHGKVETQAPTCGLEVPIVSLERACALITTHDETNAIAHVSSYADKTTDLVERTTRLIAQHQEEQPLLFGGALQSTPSPILTQGPGNDNKGKCQPEAATSLSKERTELQHPDRAPMEMPEYPKMQPSDSLFFWNRIKRALQLDDNVVASTMECCVFEHESPYPNVFLKDLDARNNDRLTRQFVDEVRPLFVPQASRGVQLKNGRLFKEACASFAKHLWEKSIEIRETLPCLPLRVEGVLLGSIYAAMRIDKQFDSLKQIYAQLKRSVGSRKGSPVDSHTLKNTEVLLLQRAKILAKSLTAEDRTFDPRSVSVRPTTADVLTCAANEDSAPTNGNEKNSILHNNTVCGAFGRYARTKMNPVGSCSRRASTAERPSQGESITEVLEHLREGHTDTGALEFPSGASIVEVYLQSCHHYRVPPNLNLIRELESSNSTFFTVLDLSSTYVGLRGLRPILELLQFNGKHLVSLSLCNNNLENDDVVELCNVLSGVAGTNLVHLNLSFNPFSQSAYPALERLVMSLRNLETLKVRQTLLSPSAERDLQKLLERQSVLRCMGRF